LVLTLALRLAIALVLTIAFLPAVTTANSRTIEIEVREVRGLETVRRFEPVRPRLVLALSGGGVRGAAHIGVLEILDSAGVQIDGIAGTSVGALIGTLYCCGLKPKDIEERLRGIDWEGMLLDEPERRSLPLARKAEHGRNILLFRLGKDFTPVVPAAISPGQVLYRHLLRLTLDLPMRSADWNDLPTPLAIVASDLITGNSVVINRGDPALAIRASMALPLLFDPLPLDSMMLIDGGVSANIPTDAARALGGDIVLASDVTAALRPPTQHWKPWQIVDQVSTILEREQDARARNRADFVVEPEVSELTLEMPTPYDSLLESGRRAMRKILPDLQKVLNLEVRPDDFDTLWISDALIESSITRKIDALSPTACGGMKGGVFSSSVAPRSGMTIPMKLDSLEKWKSRGWTTIGKVKQLIHRLYTKKGIHRIVAYYSDLSRLLTLNIEHMPVVKRVVIVGNKSVSSHLLYPAFDKLTNLPLIWDKLTDAILSAQRHYREQGYPAAVVKTPLFDTLTGTLTITIDEGLLGDIKFVGLRNVPSFGLAEEVPLKRGKPITRQGILTGAANLYATGLFRNVYPVLKPSGAGEPWTLEFHIIEHPAPLVRMELAYQHEHRTRGAVEMTFPSPINYAARFTLFAGFGQRDQLHRVSMDADKFFSYPLTLNIASHFARQERTIYNRRHFAVGSFQQERWGGEVKVGGVAAWWGLFRLTGRWEQHSSTYRDISATYSLDKYRLATLGGELAFDTEDRSPYPNQGVRFAAAFETAGKIYGSQREFSKLAVHWEGYSTPVARHTIGFRLAGQTTTEHTPLDERPRIGGMYSVPGLHLDAIIGKHQALGGFDYRFDLLSRVLADAYIGLGWITAASWNEPAKRFVKDDWLHSAAVYIVLDTVFGPLQLQWGHLFNSGGMPKHNVISLQTGNAF